MGQQGLAAAGRSAGRDAASSGPQVYNPRNEAIPGINPWGGRGGGETEALFGRSLSS